VRATGAEVWIAEPRGELVARSLTSGRSLWSLRIPRGAAAVAAWETPAASIDGATSADAGAESGAAATPTAPIAPRAFWIALVTEAADPGAGYGSITETGKSLILIEVTDRGEKIAETAIGNRGITFTGQRWIAGATWLLAYNEAADDGRWHSRVSAFDPARGEVRRLLEAPIAGKGTGLAPRVALARTSESGDLALALGNAEGFGLYRPAPAEEAQAQAAPAESAASAAAEGGTISQDRPPDGGGDERHDP
jgi:hypothetical protein